VSVPLSSTARSADAAPSALRGVLAGWRPWALLAALCLALYLPGIASVPPLDRDESRFAQATRQMLETGDYVRIRFQDEARNKKPVGIYWLQAASVSLFGSAEGTALWPYRLPSLLGALAAVLLTFQCGRRLFGTGREGTAAALLGAGLLAACVSLQIEAHLAKTDAVLLATVVAAQGALAGIYRRHRACEPASAALAAAFWIAQGIGILIKGPIAPIVSAMTVLALAAADRDWRGWPGALRIGWGLPLALALVLPWLVAVQVATSGGFLAEAVGHDMLGKMAGGQEAHGAPPGYYLLLLLATFWPGSLFLAAAARRAWRHRAGFAERFLLAWMLPTWILFECVPTKLPHYVLPAYPALALLAGRALAAALEFSLSPRGRGRGPAEGREGEGDSASRRSLGSSTPHPDPLPQGERGKSKLAGRFDLAIAVLWAAVTLALGGAALALPFVFGTPGGVAPAGVLAAAAALAIAAVGVRDAFRGRQGPRTAVLVVAGSALLCGAVFHAVLPSLDRLWLSRGAAALVASAGGAAGSGGKPVDSVGYTEPSLVFLLGTATRFVGPEQAAADLGAGRSVLALVTDRDEAAFRAALSADGIATRPAGSVAGLDYSNGRRMTLTLYTVAEGGGRE